MPVDEEGRAYVPDEVAHQCSEEDQTCGARAEIVRGFGEDLRDGVEGDDAGGAAKGELNAGEDNVGEREEEERTPEVLEPGGLIVREVVHQGDLLAVGARQDVDFSNAVAGGYRPCRLGLPLLLVGVGCLVDGRCWGRQALVCEEAVPGEHGVIEGEDEEKDEDALGVLDEETRTRMRYGAGLTQAIATIGALHRQPMPSEMYPPRMRPRMDPSCWKKM